VLVRAVYNQSIVLIHWTNRRVCRLKALADLACAAPGAMLFKDHPRFSAFDVPSATHQYFPNFVVERRAIARCSFCSAISIPSTRAVQCIVPDVDAKDFSLRGSRYYHRVGRLASLQPAHHLSLRELWKRLVWRAIGLATSSTNIQNPSLGSSHHLGFVSLSQTS
jgi:hypothetical protein